MFSLSCKGASAGELRGFCATPRSVLIGGRINVLIAHGAQAEDVFWCMIHAVTLAALRRDLAVKAGHRHQ